MAPKQGLKITSYTALCNLKNVRVTVEIVQSLYSGKKSALLKPKMMLVVFKYLQRPSTGSRFLVALPFATSRRFVQPLEGYGA